MADDWLPLGTDFADDLIDALADLHERQETEGFENIVDDYAADSDLELDDMLDAYEIEYAAWQTAMQTASETF